MRPPQTASRSWLCFPFLLLAGLLLQAPIATGQPPLFPPQPHLTTDMRSRLTASARDSTLARWQREFMLEAAQGKSEPAAATSSQVLPDVALPLAGIAADDGAWIAVPPPAARYSHAAIYDPVRDRMVVFGGYDGDNCRSDVWVLSLSGSPTWSALAPVGTPPSTCGNPAAIYDPVRDRMVVFGGNANDVWALSLAGSPAWTAIAPTGSTPSAHYSATAIYDPVRDRMVVFGGYDAAGGYLNDVWALSLAGSPAWSELVAAGSPPAGRSAHTAIYDPVRDRMVVFGGYSAAAGYLGDVWALSLAGSPAWSALAPTGSPPSARYGHTAIYDPVRDRVVVFGGYDGSLNASRNDVWGLSLAGSPAWSQLTPAGSPPSALLAHAAIYDPVRDRMVVFGGYGTGNDVSALLLVGNPAWSVLAPGTQPSERDGHTAIYDPVRDRMVVFGGAFSNEVWVLSLVGSPAWSALAPVGTPPSARDYHTAIYDPVRDRMVVFGGYDGNSNRNDVWALSLSGSPAWSALAPTGSPPSARYGHTAIYDPVRDRMVVFGGSDGSTSWTRDVWALSLSGSPAWTQVGGVNGPDGHIGSTAIYDPLRDRMVVFGGYSYLGGYSNDVWALSLAGSLELTILNPPTGTRPSNRAYHTAIYDPVRDRMVVFGGSGAGFSNDVWVLSLSGSPAWSELAPAGTPPSGRTRHTAIYDPARDRMVVFGGYGSGDRHSYRNDAWALEWGQGTRSISASANPGGTISPSGTVSVTYGHNQAFTIAPDACHTTADVLVDGVSVGAVGSYIFTNIQANHSIVARFTPGGPGVAAAPTGLTVTNTGTAHSLDLKWDRSPGSEVTGYLIHRTYGGTTDPPIPVTDPAYTDDLPLTRNTTYTYRVVAVTACGAGPPSASVSRAPDYFPVLLVHGICGADKDFTDCPLDANRSWQPMPACLLAPPIRLGDRLVGYGLGHVYVMRYDFDERLYRSVPVLQAAIEAVLADAQDTKLVIVAHSQGGLISRSLLQTQPAYRGKIDQLVMIGTPNHGAPVASASWISKLPFVNNSRPLCLLYADARYDLAPGSDFLNKLNYGDDHTRYDGLMFSSCTDHKLESLPSSGPEQWLISGGGVRCKTFNLTTCGDGDGIVAWKDAVLTSLPSSHQRKDADLPHSGTFVNAKHYGGIIGAFCGKTIEELKHGDIADAVYNIITRRSFTIAGVAAAPARVSAANTLAAEDPTPMASLPGVSGELNVGEVREDIVAVDGGGEFEVLQIADDPGVTLALVSPGGRVVTSADTTAGDVSYEEDPTLGVRALGVSSSEVGAWIVRSGAPISLAGTTAYSILPYVSTTTGLELEIPSVAARPGQSVTVRAALGSLAAPVPGASFQGTLLNPDLTTQSVSLFDDGQHDDGAAADGVFGAVVVPPLAGTYDLMVQGDATLAGTGQTVHRVAHAGFAPQAANDLAVSPSDISMQRVRLSGDSLLISVRVHDLGELGAPDAIVTLSESGASPFAAIHVQVPTGNGATAIAGWHPSRSDVDTLMVNLDANYAFVEDRYDNNIAQVVVHPAIVAVEPVPLPSVVSLSPGYPNPSRGEATIEFALPRATEVSLRVYDVAGRLVKTLVEGAVPPGTHTEHWDGRRNEGTAAASGVYFYELRADGRRLMRRLLILR